MTILIGLDPTYLVFLAPTVQVPIPKFIEYPSIYVVLGDRENLININSKLH